jgi:hypothetical protein
MAIKKEIELDIKVESVGNLKQQLREAQKEVEALSDKFGATSEAAIKAAKKAAELKDQIGDAKALTDAFNPDAKFKALTSSLSGVAAGFGAFQGALGLVGVEGEQVEKTLLKVQSAMAISEGLQQLGEARDSFKQLGAVAKSVFTGIKGAVAATGIGLLVIALGTIYTYWDDIKGALSGVSDEQDRLNEKAHQNVLIEQQKLDKLNSQDNSLRLQGLTEKEILKLKIAQTDEVIKKSELELEQTINTHKAQVEAEERNKKILTGIIQFTTIPLQLILKTIDKVGSFLGKDFNLTDKLNDWSSSLIFDPKKVKYEGYLVEKEARENLAKLKESRAGYQLQINAIDKNAEAERARIKKESYKNQADEDKAEMERRAMMAQGEIDADAASYEYFAAQDKKKADEKEAARLKELEDEQILATLREQIRLKEVKDEEDKQARLKQLRANQIQGTLDTLSLLSNLAELFAGKSKAQQERAFKIQKAANIAATLIETYLGAQKAYTSQIIPLDPTSVIRGALAAAVVVSSGLLNVKKIASTQFNSGGASGGGGSASVGGMGGGASGGGSSVISPNFNIVGNNGQNQLGNLAPVQAYVVSGDMTSQQQLDRNRLRNATF